MNTSTRQIETTPWTAAPATIDLPVNEVHLWRMDLDLPLMAALRDTLSLPETLHAERMARAEDRRRFIAGCGQLRTILSRYLGMEAAAIPLGYALSGEPVTMRMPHTVYFDWERAENLGLVVVSHIENVTLEFEHVCSGLPLESIADHFLEPRENWNVRIAPADKRHGEFYRTWTGREALRRAGGDESSIVEIAPEDGFAAAIAARGENWRLRCWDC